jgi:hypothetical protein
MVAVILAHSGALGMESKQRPPLRSFHSSLVGAEQRSATSVDRRASMLKAQGFYPAPASLARGYGLAPAMEGTRTPEAMVALLALQKG